MEKQFNIGDRVVRSKGDYVVGRTGTIIEIDNKLLRARINWDENPKTWVKFKVIELESIPYKIIPGEYNDKRWSYPKYVKL